MIHGIVCFDIDALFANDGGQFQLKIQPFPKGRPLNIGVWTNDRHYIALVVHRRHINIALWQVAVTTVANMLHKTDHIADRARLQQWRQHCYFIFSVGQFFSSQACHSPRLCAIAQIYQGFSNGAAAKVQIINQFHHVRGYQYIGQSLGFRVLVTFGQHEGVGQVSIQYCAFAEFYPESVEGAEGRCDAKCK